MLIANSNLFISPPLLTAGIAKNAAKRRKKKEAKAKRDAIAKGTGGTHAFEDDGSFMAKAKALVKEKE